MWVAWVSLMAFASGNIVPASNDILAEVSAASARRRLVEYQGERHYLVRNLRFGKAAALTVQVSFRPDVGKTFTIVDRSGSEKLLAIVERLLAVEVESSRAPGRGHHEIGPANYQAQVRGIEEVDGRPCYVLELTPKSHNKYLIAGTLWVDRETYGIVRLDGTTASSVSFWLGCPRVTEHFEQVEGIWLPRHTRSVSNTTLLGESELEIHYSGYRVRLP